ncbi:MAG: metallophosphoesterase family protein [Tissierellaceae bacterium]|nr:metallophosphoesterase family protein [Tissierellaceae bacterium]
MRLLFFTDSHIRGTSPKNRKDDYVQTLENKMLEIVDIVNDKNIDFVLHGGDLFDRPDVSISITSRFSKILKKIQVPIYLISGNHDVYGHNPQTINRTMLGLLNELDILNLINEEEKIILHKGSIKVQLTGQPYIYNIDDKINKKYYMLEDVDESVNYAIHIVHGMLLDKPFIKGVPFTLVDDIKDTKADITIAGHYHSGFNNITIEGKHFINPGSIVRISNSLREIERRPKVIIIDLDDEIKFTDIYLESALTGDLVLDRDEIEKNIFKRERLYEFKQTVDSAMDFEKMDINDVLIEVSKSEGLSEEVKIEALNRIAMVQMKGLDGD